MKKLIFLLLCAALFLVGLTGCSDEPALPITEFIDERVDQFANNHSMLASHEGPQRHTLTEEQWQTIRGLFNEISWIELEDYQPSNNRSFEGYMTFWSIDDTIVFLIPELIAHTIEFNNSKFVRNRYFTVDKETVELIEALLVSFIY